MKKTQILTKLLANRKNPDVFKEVSNSELAELVLFVLTQVDLIEKAIKEGRLDGKTPRPDVEYLSAQTQQRMLRELVSGYTADLEHKAREFETRVKDAIASIRDGENGIVSDEEIQRAGEIASQMIELPNYESLITQEPTAVRDALELLPEGEKLDVKAIEKIEIEDVEKLREELQELRYLITQIPSLGGGGGISKNFVVEYVAQQVALGGGGGGAVPFTPTETTGTTFTGNGGTPQYVVVNGVTYFENHGYTFAGNTITLEYAVESGGYVRIFY